jgi:hypothetical protein
MNKTDNLKFLGVYKKYDPNGKIIKYSIGDTVDFDGIYYAATKTIIGLNPLAKDSGWERVGDINPNRFFVQTDEPVTKTLGDRWLNPDTGKTYTLMRDANGLHWVEF